MSDLDITLHDKVRADRVRDTVQKLADDMRPRFTRPRGLFRISDDLLALVDEVEAGTAKVRRRQQWLGPLTKIGITAVIVVCAVVMFLAIRTAVRDAPDSGLEWLPILESAVNDLVFAGIAIWFLYGVPERMQRAELLRLLHRLRSLAHIVDMHQLTKDVQRIRRSAVPYAIDGNLGMATGELEVYLDYCAELLSLIGKTAALCAEESQDGVVLSTVSTVEELTAALERKIWQKITVLNASRGFGAV